MVVSICVQTGRESVPAEFDAEFNHLHEKKKSCLLVK